MYLLSVTMPTVKFLDSVKKMLVQCSPMLSADYLSMKEMRTEVVLSLESVSSNLI